MIGNYFVFERREEKRAWKARMLKAIHASDIAECLSRSLYRRASHYVDCHRRLALRPTRFRRRSRAA